VKPPRDVTECDHWHPLVAHGPVPTLRELFAADPDRARRWIVDAGDLRIDLSKHLVDEAVWASLIALADEMDIERRRDDQLAGRVVNTTERRPAAHTVLRAPRHTSLHIAGVDAVEQVHEVLDRMAELANRVRDGHWRGSTGRRLRTVINVGIGGSDLGPQMVYEALRHLALPGLECRFVSNVDGAHLAMALRGVDPAETLLLVSSKTFTTAETMANARSARAWLVESLGENALGDHMVAVTTNVDAAVEFGVRPEAVFGFWDWVGGRFSLDSAIGLSVMIAMGPEAFGELLGGMRLIDEHVATAPVHRNAPILMALLGVWYTGVLGFPSRVVVPYAQQLHRFPAYLQQLEMESNGKSVRHDGTPVSLPTSPVVWGEPGTNGQHAFFQLLHQGTHIVPVDFIGFSRSPHVLSHSVDLTGHHDLLLANLLAQSAALAFGRTADEVASAGVAPELVPHRTFPGNRPSTVILAEALSPSTLGQIVSLYEHVVTTQGLLWGINSFDQWGVELGKELATSLVPALVEGVGVDQWDSSTRESIVWLRRTR
jgi:glucose-6-phosphate isomerase